MAIDIFMVITDQSNAVLAGESTTPVFDPYLKQGVVKPAQIGSLAGETEQTFSFSSGGGGGAGKVVFDPFVITKQVDVLSQTFFAAHAAGIVWKYVDLLVVRASDGPTPLRPYLSYRLGTVGISDIKTATDDDSVQETVSFVFGQLQIGYQLQKPDGTAAPFTPVGWDRVRNVRI